MGFTERQWGHIPQQLQSITHQHELKQSNPLLDKYYKTFVSVNMFMPNDISKVIMYRLDSLYSLQNMNQDTLVKKEDDGETFIIGSDTIKFWYKEFTTDNLYTNVKYTTMYYTESGVAGIGIIKYEDRIYIGEIKNGISDGKGTLTYYKNEKESIYEGDVYDGEAHGYGEYKYKYNDDTGCDICRGYYEYDYQHGYGEQYYSDGSYYKGEFKNNRYDGKGLIVYENGNTFEGDFINDECNIGIYRYKNGNVIRYI